MVQEAEVAGQAVWDRPKTVAKRKKHTSISDLPAGPKKHRSTVLSIDEEAVVVAFQRHAPAAA
jgi:hypothetical protein